MYTTDPQIVTGAGGIVGDMDDGGFCDECEARIRSAHRQGEETCHTCHAEGPHDPPGQEARPGDQAYFEDYAGETEAS